MSTVYIELFCCYCICPNYSFAFVYLVIPELFVEKAIMSMLSCFKSPYQDQLPINVRVYL